MTHENEGPAPSPTGTGPSEKSAAAAKPPLASTDECTAGADGFQPMPPLTAEEYAALRDDIAARGVLVPVTVDEAMELAVTLNATRRHLNREQRREQIHAEIAHRPGDSDRAIARRLGCSPSTVGAVRGGGVSNLDTTENAEAEPITEQHLAERFARIIEDRYADDPDTWRVPHDLAKYIRFCWPWPTHPQHVAHRKVAYALFMCCPPESPVWDLMNVWLYAVAEPALREYADLEETDPHFEWPGKALAELCLAVCDPALSAEVQLTLRRRLEAQIAFAILDCERFVSQEDIAKWRAVAGLPNRGRPAR